MIVILHVGYYICASLVIYLVFSVFPLYRESLIAFAALQVSMEITMSSKGQIVIPLSIRKMFGLKKGEKFTVDVENGDIKLIPKTVNITKLVGSVKPLFSPEEVQKKIREDRDNWR